MSIDGRYPDVPLHLRITHPLRPVIRTTNLSGKQGPRPQKKWSDDMAKKIHYWLAEGWTFRRVAQELGMHVDTARRKYEDYLIEQGGQDDEDE